MRLRPLVVITVSKREWRLAASSHLNIVRVGHSHASFVCVKMTIAMVKRQQQQRQRQEKKRSQHWPSKGHKEQQVKWTTLKKLDVVVVVVVRSSLRPSVRPVDGDKLPVRWSCAFSSRRRRCRPPTNDRGQVQARPSCLCRAKHTHTQTPSPLTINNISNTCGPKRMRFWMFYCCSAGRCRCARIAD